MALGKKNISDILNTRDVQTYESFTPTISTERKKFPCGKLSIKQRERKRELQTIRLTEQTLIEDKIRHSRQKRRITRKS